MEYHIKKCDLVLPLVAIATPSVYVEDPLKVFELDFEANLPIVRKCVQYKKRLLFPSTSEVYGMSGESEFNPYDTDIVLGPINKSRWIYSCSKQLMDRVIHAYGDKEGLDYTLFRPFNWYGTGLDSIYTPKEGSSRVITQFLGNIVRGNNLSLVDGGLQKRAFTYVDDGVDALFKIIENRDGVASGKIYNIGNPNNDYSIKELANIMLDVASEIEEYSHMMKKVKIVDVHSDDYYGKGYQDVKSRVPWINNLKEELGWSPKINLKEGIREIFKYYKNDIVNAKNLLSE